MNDTDTIIGIDTITVIDTLTVIGPRVSPVKDFTDWHYSDESYFAGSPYYHPGQHFGSHGVIGTPIPYTVSRDNSISLLLIIIFVIGISAISLSRAQLTRQIKNFFYVPRRIAEMTTTVLEVRAQYILALLTATDIAIICHLYSHPTATENILSLYTYAQVGLYTLVICCFLLLRDILYHCINWVFFDKKKNEQWQRTWLFLTDMEGILIFPAIIAHVYTQIPLEFVASYALFVVLFVKLLTFYKCKTIFFNGIGGFLQIILYFCALEIVPLLFMGGTLMEIRNYIDIYF